MLRSVIALSRVAKSAVTKSTFPSLSPSPSPSPSPCGCGSVRSPFSTVSSRRRKRKSIRKPPVWLDILDDFIDETPTNDDRTNPAILVSPLVQVFSVSVHTNFDDDRPCELYGSIRVTGTTDFTLYDRNRDNPETIILNKHGNNYLSLIGPRPRPQHGNNYLPLIPGTLGRQPPPRRCDDEELSCSLSTTTTKIELDLKDKNRNDMELIKSHLVLDYNTPNNTEVEEVEDWYDKAVVVGAEHYFALVHYATFRFAVFAFVEVAIFAKYDELSRPVSEIYGSIVAGYSNIKSYNSSKRNSGSDSIKCSTLFNRPQDEPLPATVSTPFTLSRYIVAVPVHSSLKIEAHLWDRYNSDYSGPFASGFVEFFGPHAFDHNACTKLIRGEAGSVVVSVTWDNALEYAQELRDFEGEERLRHRREREGGRGRGGGYHPRNNNEALMLQNKPALPSSTRALTLKPIIPSEFVEVISVFVDSKANEVPAICGFVKIQDGSRSHIFQHDISDPRFCSPNKRMIPLGINCTVYFSHLLCITLFLKDLISGVVISNGTCCRDGQTFGWYDKHLCSVIPGTHGYAAVHYIVLHNACTASIEITIIDDDLDISAHARSSSTLLSPPSFNNNRSNNNDIHVHGCIFAQYKSHDYSSVYAKKYYRSILFDKPESESVELTKTHLFKLPLLKSAVIVPIYDSLIIEANLYATRSNGNPKEEEEEEAVFGTVEFEVDGNVCTLYKRIQRQRFCIQISVQLTASV